MSTVWKSVLAPALKLFALCASVAGLVLGAGLVLRSEATLRMLRALNRWISTRRSFGPSEAPRSLERRTRDRRLWLGLALAGAGAYVLIVLVWSFDRAQIASSLGAKEPGSPAAVALEWARWTLGGGAVLSVGAGLLMALAPRALESLEARLNRRVSARQVHHGGDAMHLALDRILETFPRAAGALILILSLAGCAASLVLLRY